MAEHRFDGAEFNGLYYYEYHTEGERVGEVHIDTSRDEVYDETELQGRSYTRDFALQYVEEQEGGQQWGPAEVKNQDLLEPLHEQGHIDADDGRLDTKNNVSVDRVGDTVEATFLHPNQHAGTTLRAVYKAE